MQTKTLVFIKFHNLVQGFSSNITLEPFGSYKYDWQNTESDIDVVALGSDHSREEFMDAFADYMFAKNVECFPVKDAFIPILKIKLDTIDIDLAYVNLNTSYTEIDKRILAGPSISAEIIRLVPDLNKMKTLLGIIKKWAKARDIYSNIYGYLGGIAWTILVARILVAHPFATIDRLLLYFFELYSHRNWQKPLYLTEPLDTGDINSTTFSPKLSSKDRTAHMPVLTPYYMMNTTHNVTKFTFQTLKSEFKRGYKLIFQNKVDMLAQPEPLVYKTFIHITVTTDLARVITTISSRLRKLLFFLERVEGLHQARLIVDDKTNFKIGLKGKGNFDLTEAIGEFLYMLKEYRNQVEIKVVKN